MGYEGPFELDPAVTSFLSRDPANFVEGKRTGSQSEKRLPVRDPSSGREIAQAVDSAGADVDAAVESARSAFDDGRWRNLTPVERERILLKFADLVEQQGEVFAQLETLEQGKSITISRFVEVGASVDWIRYAAGLATKISGRTFDVSLPGGAMRSTAYTVREPIGVVAGIAPWNFPMMIGVWKVLPALAAGCSIVLKPSELTPLTALMLAETAIEAGVPEGVFNVVTGRGDVAGEALVRHPKVSKISFTGSTPTGKLIGRYALDDLKRVTLELGGKNPAIVLKDADLAKVVPGLMAGGFFNAGQVCAATSRVYAESSIYDDLVDAVGTAIGALTLGPGLDPAAQLNPLVSGEHQQKVRGMLEEARSAGAELREGQAVPQEGFYASPTLVLNPAPGLRLASEEVFGPVLNIIRVSDREQALELANETRMGLAASVWTKDLEAAMQCTRGLRAGTVWVNRTVSVDPNMPFGGLKESGIGREFGTDWLSGYTEEKSICIAH